MSDCKNTLMSVRSLGVVLDNSPILNNVSFDVCENDWLMIVGPNGAGKSTVTRALGRNVDYTGSVLLAGSDIKDYSSIEYAKLVGFLSQNNSVGFDFTVREIVEMGLYAHKNNKQKHSSKMEYAIEVCGLQNLLSKPVSKISGGELQRTFLAQVLTQDPSILVLDEPTNHLDLKFQEEIFEIVDTWRKQPSCAVVSIVHDLTLAKKFATSAVLLSRGKLLASGVPKDVFVNENLSQAYGLNVNEYMSSLLSVWD